MSAHHDVQLDFAIAIGVWAMLVIAAVATATWRRHARISPILESASDHDHVAKPGHGATATWKLAEPIQATATDQPTVPAAAREKSHSEAVVAGPYEFYEWL